MAEVLLLHQPLKKAYGVVLEEVGDVLDLTRVAEELVVHLSWKEAWRVVLDLEMLEVVGDVVAPHMQVEGEHLGGEVVARRMHFVNVEEVAVAVVVVVAHFLDMEGGVGVHMKVE